MADAFQICEIFLILAGVITCQAPKYSLKEKLMRNISYAALIVVLTGFMPFESSAAERFYVTSNKVDGNTIVVFQEDASGKFHMSGEYLTGGKGTGDLEIPALKKDETHPLANGDDPLISANAIEATKDRKYLVTVNPGDGSISLMRNSGDQGLKSVNTVPASDRFPISVAIFGRHVIVASVGKDNAHGSIAAYKIADDKLVSVSDSRRDLKARPSTVRFSSDGEHVIVNELVTGKIKVYAMDGDTLSVEPVSQISSPRQAKDRFHAIPVGFVVAGNGGDDVLLVSEARFLTPDFKLRAAKNEVPQSPLYSWQTGSVSTYKLDDGGNISSLSKDVLTGSNVEGGEIANCWVALSKDGKILYAANAFSSSISSFDVETNGTVRLKSQTVFKDPSESLFFGDLSVSRNGKMIFQLIGNKGQVMVFDIADDGSLKPKQTLNGLPTLGAYGLLVH